MKRLGRCYILTNTVTGEEIIALYRYTAREARLQNLDFKELGENLELRLARRSK